jgi:N utilization substance protein B
MPDSTAANRVGESTHRKHDVDPRQARVLAVQLLAQLDVQGDSFLDEVDAFLGRSDLDPTDATRTRAAELARRGWAGRMDFDREMTAAAEHWSVERMSPVDRNVIRIALAELAEARTPPRVVLNEAIEISREYGSAESARFVNGLLDAIYKRATTGPADEDKD